MRFTVDKDINSNLCGELLKHENHIVRGLTTMVIYSTPLVPICLSNLGNPESNLLSGHNHCTLQNYTFQNALQFKLHLSHQNKREG